MVSALGGQPGWQKGDGFYKAVGMEEKAMSSICGSLRLHKKKMLSRFGKTEETEVRATFQGSTKTGCCPFCGEAEEVNKGTRMFGGSRWLLRNCGLSVDIRTCGEYWSTG